MPLSPLAAKPSRVVHIRNIPNESSEVDVMHLGVPFGRVTNVLVLKGKNQAFLEMADESAATSMVTMFTATPPIVRGRTVYVQFSNHRELKTDQNHTATVSARTFPLPLAALFSLTHSFSKECHPTNPGSDPVADRFATAAGAGPRKHQLHHGGHGSERWR